MRKTAIALATAGLIAFTVTAPVQAEAHSWHGARGNWHGWHRHNNGAAIGLGILGGILAGAAVASSHYYAPYGYGYGWYGYYR